MSDELPKGWVTARISEIAETHSGGTPSTAKREYWDNGDVPWINSGALKDCVISQPSTYITKLGSQNSAAKLFPKNTVVIALTGATTGRVGMLYFACSANQSVTGIFPSEVFIPSYVFNFLRFARPQVLELAIGSAQPHINKRLVDDFEIPLAPIDEQQRIVAKLEALLGKVDGCQPRLAKVATLLKRFRQSILAAACSGRLTADWREEHDLDDEWPVEPLSEFFEMRNGKSLVATKRQEGKIPVYGGNGLMGTHNAANAEGLVIVIGRVGAQCGNVHYVTGKVWVTDNAISLQGKKELVPAFYAYFLRSLNLNTMSAGTGQPYVSQEILGPIETPVVSLAEQQEIVRRVAALFALADQLELRLAQARGQVAKLTPSLLARAFAGQLVPQNPKDEPASALLERIKVRS